MKKKIFYCLVLCLAAPSAMAQELPVADMLDVEFNIDGTAIDVSPMKNPVEYLGSGTVISYNSIFGRHIATMNNEWGKKCTGCFRVDYEENEAFNDGLADSHSLEILVKANYEGHIPNVNCYPFSSMEAGGTGIFMGKGSSEYRSFSFGPNVTETGASTYRYAISEVTPILGLYYHVICVWNKDDAKAYIYVDGVLCNAVDAPGDFRPANAGVRWFCIGGDAGPSGGTGGWNGDIVIARVYDKPLTSAEVELLWNQVKEPEKEANTPTYTSFIEEGRKYLTSENLVATQTLLDDYSDGLTTLEGLIAEGSYEELTKQYNMMVECRKKIEASAAAYANYKSHVEAAISSLEENAAIKGDDRNYLELYLKEYFEPSENYPHGSSLYIWETHMLSEEDISLEAEWVDEKLRVVLAMSSQYNGKLLHLTDLYTER